MIRKVALAGYYGMSNTGDDALAAACAWCVGEALRPGRITVLSGRRLVMPRGLPLGYSSPRLLYGRSKLKAAWQALRHDLWVYGGGSVFHDRGGLAGLQLKLADLSWVRRGGHRAIAFGVSVGPLGTVAGRDLMSRILDRLEFLYVRDQSSLEVLRSLGREDQAMVALDPACLLGELGLPPPPPLTGPLPPPDVPCIAVAPCDTVPPGPEDRRAQLRRERRRALAEALAAVLRQSEAHLLLLSFNGHPAHADDGILRNLAAMLPRGRWTIRPYHRHPLVAFELLRRSRVVLGMRLHACVLAYAAERPWIGLAYHEKIGDFARSCGLPEGQLMPADGCEPASLARITLAALNDPAAHLARVPLAEARQSLERCSAHLRGLLGG